MQKKILPHPPPFPCLLLMLVLFFLGFVWVFFEGGGVSWNAILMIFSIEIYCCSCQHSVSAEGKGMWIVGRLEVHGRWEPGKDCFLLYPVPRWAQIAVFLWQSLTPSDMAKQTGWCLHIAVTTSLSLWHQLRVFKKFPELKSSKKHPLFMEPSSLENELGGHSLKFKLEYGWWSLQFSHQLVSPAYC